MACRAPEAVGLNGLILGGLKNHMGLLAAANTRSVLVVRPPHARLRTVFRWRRPVFW